MNKVPLEIIIPVFNEGEKVVRLMEFFKSNIKTKFRVLFCYDLENDNIFAYKEKFKNFNFEILLIKNSSRGPCSAIKQGFKAGNSDCVIVYPVKFLTVPFDPGIRWYLINIFDVDRGAFQDRLS